MEMNFKDFLNFFKLPPHIFSALAIGSGLILFVPDKIAQKLYLLSINKLIKYKTSSAYSTILESGSPIPGHNLLYNS